MDSVGKARRNSFENELPTVSLRQLLSHFQKQVKHTLFIPMPFNLHALEEDVFELSKVMHVTVSQNKALLFDGKSVEVQTYTLAIIISCSRGFSLLLQLVKPRRTKLASFNWFIISCVFRLIRRAPSLVGMVFVLPLIWSG